MIRYPVLVVIEAVTALGIATAAGSDWMQPEPEAPGVCWVALLGEREGADGSWTGADLATRPDWRADRFQISIRCSKVARIRLEVLEADGPRRLFPSAGGAAVIRAEQPYGLPTPNAFYEVRGRVRLRLTVAALDAASPSRELAERIAIGGTLALPLSDGSRARVVERGYRFQQSAQLEIELGSP